MPNVEVRDGDGKLLQTYEIFVDQFDSIITNESVIQMAKMNAIDDELVPANRVGDLTFKLIE